MDLSDPKTWTEELRVVIGAPHIVVPLLLLVGGGAWWLKDKIDDGEVRGLKAKNEVLDERLKLAADREQAVQEARDELEKQVEELKAQIAAGATRETLAPVTARVDAALGEFRSANTALRQVISVPIGQSASVAANVIRARKRSE
jgi:hypothetical protein